MIKDHKKSKANEVIETIHDINKRKAELDEKRVPHVGVIYVFSDEDIFIYKEPVEFAVEQGRFLTSSADHRSLWNALQYTVPNFKDLPYDYYPRGRVLYDNDMFYIHLDPCIYKNKNVITKIVSDLYLQPGKYKVVKDMSYTCRSCKN